MIAFVNNLFIDQDIATVGIGDLAVQRGYGIFDFFRIGNNIPLFLDDYIGRFFKSAKSLRLPVNYSNQEIKDIIDELIRKNNIPESGFRMILTGGYSQDSYQPAAPNFIVIQQPITLPDYDKFEKGVQIILHEYKRDLPHAKSVNYLMGIYLLDKIRQQKADDVLYYKNNEVLEFPRSNVFIVTKDQTVVTPSVDVLAGITRKRVLELAGHDFAVEERIVTVNELADAAEVFLTSTTKRVLPVVAIDGKKIGDGTPGKVTRELYRRFLEMEENITLAKQLAV